MEILYTDKQHYVFLAVIYGSCVCLWWICREDLEVVTVEFDCVFDFRCPGSITDVSLPYFSFIC